jgi:hypothetical protein
MRRAEAPEFPSRRRGSSLPSATSRRHTGLSGARARARGTPRWRIDDLRIPVGGRWKLRVDILVDDFDKEMLEDDVLLPRAP